MSKDIIGGVGKKVIQLAEQDFPIKDFVCAHDAIHSRVLFLKAKTEFLLVSLEMTSLPEKFIEELKADISLRFSIPLESIWITVTHTFSAPHISTEYPDFTRKVKEAAVGSISEAVTNATSVKLAADVVTTKLNVSRNVETPLGWWLGKNEQEYSNHEIKLLKVYAKENHQLLSLLFNGDLPPAVMADSYLAKGGKAVSSDFVGYTCRKLEEESTQTAIFLLGAAGDQRPLEKACEDIIAEEKIERLDQNEAGFALVSKQGEILFQEIQTSLADSKPEFLQINEIFSSSKKVLLEEKVMPVPTKLLQPTIQFDFSETGKQLDITLEGVVLGPVFILGTQPEMNSRFGKEILSSSPYSTSLLVSMVNGAKKCLPETQDFERITYTAMNSVIAAGSSEKILKEAEGFFREIEEKR